MRYPLIVFDWDGTITDSHSAIVACMQEASRELGLAIPQRERASHVIGLCLHEILRTVAPDLPAERYPEYVAAYRKHFLAREEAIQLFPGMHGLLEGLSRKHLLGIATGKGRKGLERALAAARIGDLFAASRCADETSPKPHPAMLLELMEELQVSAEAVLMIGDTSHDMEMARAAGVDAVAVTYGAHPEEGLRACGPLGCFSDVAQLRQWLKSNA